MPSVWATVALLLLATSCGYGALGSDVPGGMEIDWDAPVDGAAVTISDPSEADVLFTPDVPQGLGTPVEIETSDPASIDDVVADRQIGWVFDHPDFGRFWVVEWIVDAGATLWEWDEEAASGPPGCRGIEPAAGPSPVAEPPAVPGPSPAPPVPLYSCTYADLSLEKVGDGALGLLMQGRNVTSLEWMRPAEDLDLETMDDSLIEEPMLLVLVMGPADHFTAEMAMSVPIHGDFDTSGPITPLYTAHDCLRDKSGCIEAWRAAGSD